MFFKKEVKKYDRMEFTEIYSDEEFFIERPDGQIDKVCPFVYQPIQFEYDCHGYESMYDDGEKEYRARYTPELCGKYTVNGESFFVTESENRGYISVGKKDTRYFVYSDGTTYFPVGINMAFPVSYFLSSGQEFGVSNKIAYLGLRQYRRWLDKCAENGVNMVRLWIGHPYFTPDTEEAFKLDYKKLSLLDKIVDMARERNIKLKLTIEQFRYFEYNNDEIKYPAFRKKLYHNGKPCLNCAEWMESDKWQKAWFYKLKELSKRYNGDTTLFAIELWNEMNNCDGDVVKWCKKILPEVKKIFPKHLVTNSYGSLDSEKVKELYNNFCWEETDFVQIHRYIDQGAAYEICSHPIEMMSDVVPCFLDYNKPVLVAETGAVDDRHSGVFRFCSSDDRGIIFADTVYSPAFCGSCGAGNIWYWDNRYIESKYLYKMYKPIVKVFENINLQEEHFEFKDFSNKDVHILALCGKTSRIFYIRNNKDTWQNVLRDLNEPETIKNVVLPENTENAEIIHIWNDETAYLTNNVLNDLKYGVFIKNIK